ncbi:MAG: hypothetical protein QG656_192, partial [Candidatus Hydrogenedentes bacterium]|nr:hypothetical protein [Candidatus Hydrogenedentota bacterium]
AMPLVSVVMPTYAGDAPPYLREAIESVVWQTYAEWELLVVLDGPIGDDARRVLDTAVQRDVRIRVIALPENRGPAHARNAGIEAARGEYIALLDADDVAVPERLAKQVAFIRETGAGVVGSDCHLLDETGRSMSVKQTPHSPEAVRRALCWFNPIPNSAVLARADILKRFPFPETSRSGSSSFDGEDYALWVRLAREGYVLRNQPEALVAFRLGPRFLERRHGLHPFKTDLRTKLATLPLYPWPQRPIALAASLITASLRLLPISVLRAAYRIRHRLPFRD